MAVCMDRSVSSTAAAAAAPVVPRMEDGTSPQEDCPSMGGVHVVHVVVLVVDVDDDQAAVAAEWDVSDDTS